MSAAPRLARAMALYNEIDPYAAAWLRNLIAAGHLPAGTVEERSIADLTAKDLDGFSEAHFFAGIGGWPLALRLAGWPAGRPVWTGSCPCQPLSCAGKRRGADDERHLWPIFFGHIREHRPPVVFGEQVASPDGVVWLDAVRADLEAEGYAFAAADLCAASVGAPHERQRLFWLADAKVPKRWRADGTKHQGRRPQKTGGSGLTDRPVLCRWMGDADDSRPQGRSGGRNGANEWAARATSLDGWADADWLPCRDGKARPVEPGTFPLAHGVPGRVGKLRAYGNAIVPQVAAVFVRAYMEASAA